MKRKDFILSKKKPYRYLPPAVEIDQTWKNNRVSNDGIIGIRILNQVNRNLWNICYIRSHQTYEDNFSNTRMVEASITTNQIYESFKFVA